MSLLLLWAGARGGTVVAPPTPPRDQGGPPITPRSIRQVRDWELKWDDEDALLATIALLNLEP